MNTNGDVILVAEGRLVYAHKLILATACPFFLNLFNTTPGINNVFVIDGVSYLDLCMVLQFIYTGNANVNPSHADHLIYLLSLFGIDGNSDRHQNLQADDPMDGSYCRANSLSKLKKNQESPKYKRKCCGRHRGNCAARRKLIF